MKSSLSCAVTAAAITLASCGGVKTPPADLVLKGGKIATVDKDFSYAQAVAVRGDSIIFVGSDADIAKYIGPATEVIDCAGRLVVPGLIDAHAHMLGYGSSLSELDFRGTKSFDEIISLCAEKAKTLSPGEWITGQNWDQNDWPEKEFLPHDALSKAVPDNPVWITRVDGHAGIANAKTMEIAGIAKASKSPGGGEILRKKDGSPTGVFVDNAMDLINSVVPDPTEEQLSDALEAAANGCLAVGLTGVHDAGVSPRTIALYKKLIDSGRLGMRVFAMLGYPGDGADVKDYLLKNKFDSYGDHFLKVASIKLFMDGALGSRGAAMFEDYSDRPGYTGLMTLSEERAEEVSRAALEADCQVCTHAIGDKAIDLILDAYEAALKDNPKKDHRFRVEHAQVVAPGDFQRFVDLGILPSMQPTHATSDMYWAEARVGAERVKGAYAWRSFLDLGLIVPCGSDFPVEETNPMLGIYAAITRQDPTGYPDGGWFPEQRMTREEVLKGFTIWAADAAFQDDILGSIEAGKLADMVVLSNDIMTIEPKNILSTVPDYTIVGGKVRYSRAR